MKQRYLFVLIAGAVSGLQPLMADEVNVNVNENDTIKTYNIDEVIITSSTKETNDLRLLPGSVSILSPQRLSDHAKTVSFQVSPKPSEIIYTTLLNNATINSLCFEIQLVKYKKNYLITMKSIYIFILILKR